MIDLDKHKILEQVDSNDCVVKVLVAYKKYRKWRFRVLRLLKIDFVDEVQFRSIDPVWGEQYFWIKCEGVTLDYADYHCSFGTFQGVTYQGVSQFYHALTRLF